MNVRVTEENLMPVSTLPYGATRDKFVAETTGSTETRDRLYAPHIDELPVNMSRRLLQMSRTCNVLPHRHLRFNVTFSIRPVNLNGSL